MGASAVAVTFRRAVERGPVVGQTDDVLVARVRAGDDGAFEAIYDRYARGVLAFCAQMLGSREEAEDALQLTFVSAYRGLQRSQSEIALRPWLYTIARNRCLSELRIRREAVDVDGVVAERPSFEGLADQVQRREDLRDLVQDMQRLPEDQRAALVLFEMGDHSHKEIAAVLGIRAEKVKALIFQAREGLVRGRRARERPCVEIRELLAASETRVLPRSMARAHIERCPACAAFEDEVSRQRAAFALILPVAVSAELKTSVLSSMLGGGGAAGTGAAATGGTGAAATGGTGAAAAGGTGAAATSAAAGTQSVAVVASGITAVAAATVGAGGADLTRMMAKLLTAAAIATGLAGAGHDGAQSQAGPSALSGPAQASPATAPAIHPVHGGSQVHGARPSAVRQTGSGTPGQLPASGVPATASSPAHATSPGLTSSSPGSGGATRTVSSSGLATPRDVGNAGSPSASAGQSGAAQGGGPPSSPPGQSGTAQGGGPPSSPPGQSGAAHGGPPPSPPGQSGTARSGSGQPGSPSSGNSASGASPPNTADAGTPSPPAGSGNPGNPSNSNVSTGATNSANHTGGGGSSGVNAGGGAGGAPGANPHGGSGQ